MVNRVDRAFQKRNKTIKIKSCHISQQNNIPKESNEDYGIINEKDSLDGFDKSTKVETTRQEIPACKNTSTLFKIEKLRKLWYNGKYIMHPHDERMKICRKFKFIYMSKSDMKLTPANEYRIMDYVIYLDSSGSFTYYYY